MNSRFAVGAIFVLALLVGCGPPSDMGYVTGIVTLEGEPIGSASVTFYPTNGRASVSTSKADGSYELIFTRNKMGALVGKHKVTVLQEEGANEMLQGGEIVINPDFKKANIPRKYADKKTTDLTADVVNGSNEINFDLKSK